MKIPITISWLDVPEEHDYPAAGSYLQLIFSDIVVQKYISALR